MEENAYQKIGIAAGTLFVLMMAAVFTFVYFDQSMVSDHTEAPAPQIQVETSGQEAAPAATQDQAHQEAPQGKSHDTAPHGDPHDAAAQGTKAHD